MRQKFAFMAVALGLLAAGSAQAEDATQVIYDLSVAHTPRTLAPATASGSATYRTPQSSLPITSPSMDARGADGQTLYSGDELEVRAPSHNGRVGSSAGAPRGNGGGPGNTPNPEPGTMLLLGSALGAGVKFLRRRNAA